MALLVLGGACIGVMHVGRVQDVLPGFGALLVGYARQRRCAEAVALLRRFNHIGGVPDKFMLETVLTACLTSGEVSPPPCTSSTHIPLAHILSTHIPHPNGTTH